MRVIEQHGDSSRGAFEHVGRFLEWVGDKNSQLEQWAEGAPGWKRALAAGALAVGVVAEVGAVVAASLTGNIPLTVGAVIVAGPVMVGTFEAFLTVAGLPPSTFGGSPPPR